MCLIFFPFSSVLSFWVLLLCMLGPFRLFFNLKQLWGICCYCLSYVFFRAGLLAWSRGPCTCLCDGYLCVCVRSAHICCLLVERSLFISAPHKQHVQSPNLLCSVMCWLFFVIKGPFPSPQSSSVFKFHWVSVGRGHDGEDLGQGSSQIAEMFNTGVNFAFLWEGFTSSSWQMSLFSTRSVHPKFTHFSSAAATTYTFPQ